MNLRRILSGRPGWQASLAALLAVAALAPVSAAAKSSPSADHDLSPRLVELAEPAVRSAPQSEQAAQLSLPASGPGSLLRDGNRVLVEVRLEGDALGLAALRGAGAEIVHVSRRYMTVTVAARPVDLPRIGALTGVGGVSEVLTPMVRAADCGGAARSEGDLQLNAANARAGFAADGSGITVGILSDTFDRNPLAVTRAAGDVASGDLPGPGSPCGSAAPVGLLDDSVMTGSDEGRAMAQIVHDLAPGASIDFATAFTSEGGFATNIRRLAAAGAQVIVDDVAYFEEPFFQDGPVAVAINEVAATGVSYFTAAGNENVISGGRDVASYEAPFRGAGSCPPGVPAPAGSDCMDFDPGAGTDNTYDMTVPPGAELKLNLQWSEPWNGVETDLDAYLLEGAEVLAKGENRNISASSQRPFEFLSWENKGLTPASVELAIPRFAGSKNPRIKFIQMGSGAIAPTLAQYETSSAGDVIGPTIFGHAAAAGAVTLGAVRYNDSAKPEAFSSRGPVKHYFGPVLGTAPAPATGERTISKPDLAATDGAANTFFGSLQAGVWRFYGTSAAAPHAAAVAALVRQVNPGAGVAAIRAALAGTARPVGLFGPESVGAGLVDAFGAVAALAPPPTITIAKAPPALSRNRRPTIEFGANRPVAFRCEVDGGPAQACASPFIVPAPLADGHHAIAVSGVDLAGRPGTATTSFAIDTRRPQTRIAKRPRKLIRTRHRAVRVRFRFASSEAGVRFVCKVDRGLLRFCGRKISRRFGEGRHVVKVRAQDAAGNVDSSPAVFRFRVKRIG